MTKRKMSGQTVAIVVLAILLILTAAFGGVYAYYSTKSARVSGKIYLTSLSIKFGVEGGSHSGSTEIFLTNKVVVPNEELGNDGSLVVTNESDVPVYLAVVYTIHIERCAYNAVEDKYIPTGEVIEDDFSSPFIDFGMESVGANGTKKCTDSDFFYYAYQREEKKYHCVIIKEPTSEDRVTVVAEDSLRLHEGVSNKYMSTQISFTIQAFAIAANSIDDMPECQSLDVYGKSGYIMDAIASSNEEDFDALYTISHRLFEA